MYLEDWSLSNICKKIKVKESLIHKEGPFFSLANPVNAPSTTQKDLNLRQTSTFNEILLVKLPVDSDCIRTDNNFQFLVLFLDGLHFPRGSLHGPGCNVGVSVPQRGQN